MVEGRPTLAEPATRWVSVFWMVFVFCVIPAQAGIQARIMNLDPGLRRDDKFKHSKPKFFDLSHISRSSSLDI